MTADLWPMINTGVGLSALGWLWKQSGRLDAVYQQVFGAAGENGSAKRLKTVESLLATAVSDAGQSPAGRALLRELTHAQDQLAAALAELATVDKRIEASRHMIRNEFMVITAKLEEERERKRK